MAYTLFRLKCSKRLNCVSIKGIQAFMQGKLKVKDNLTLLQRAEKALSARRGAVKEQTERLLSKL